ncbi:MAG TPA: cytochrome c3 family protein [Polyangiaceae bacterium]|nr:cytochrome c3 family protein [Polyangiaceae bacterium]
MRFGSHTAALLLLVAAACGGAAQTAQPPVSPVPEASGSASGPASALPPTAPLSSSAPAGSATPAAPTQEAVPVEMKAPVPSALTADLQALGLDAKRLPPIEKLEPKALRGVMKLMAKSLGVKCGDCHQEGDFAAPTRRKKIAAHMWDDLVVKLSMAEGGPLFCDSCHQGRVQQLDRRDKKALAKWMDANFVDKLARKDAKSQECETCHVDMEMQLLAKWGGK